MKHPTMMMAASAMALFPAPYAMAQHGHGTHEGQASHSGHMPAPVPARGERPASAASAAAAHTHTHVPAPPATTPSVATATAPSAVPVPAAIADAPHVHNSPPQDTPTGGMDHRHHGAARGPSGHAALPHTPTAPARTTPPSPPTNHAADAIYDPTQMARAREILRKENGAFATNMLLFDIAELQTGKHSEYYRLSAEAWFGGDRNRLVLRMEGEGELGGKADHIETQMLWSRPITPFWNIQAGARHDFNRHSDRSFAALGVEGVAPYWLHMHGQIFLSTKGEVSMKAEAAYDQRITPRLVIQPRAETQIMAQNVPELRVGSGLTNVELGARLRYEISPDFAPYIGVTWARKLGHTADIARADREGISNSRLVAGLRFWF